MINTSKARLDTAWKSFLNVSSFIYILKVFTSLFFLLTYTAIFPKQKSVEKLRKYRIYSRDYFESGAWAACRNPI